MSNKAVILFNYNTIVGFACILDQQSNYIDPKKPCTVSVDFKSWWMIDGSKNGRYYLPQM